MAGTVVDAPHRRVTLAEVRDEADDDSGLDLLVEMEPGRGYFAMSGFALDVEELLNVFTQVATPNGLKARIRDDPAR